MIIIERDLLRIIVDVNGGDNDVGYGDTGLCDEREGRDEISRGVMMSLVICDQPRQRIGGRGKRGHRIFVCEVVDGGDELAFLELVEVVSSPGAQVELPPLKVSVPAGRQPLSLAATGPSPSLSS